MSVAARASLGGGLEFSAQECSAGSHDSSLFTFLRSFHTDCYGGHTSSPSHPQEMRPCSSSLHALTSVCSLQDSHSVWAEMEF